MAAANPAQRIPTGLAPYYRRYELPWSPSEEMERRFRTILRNLAIVFGIIAVLMPFLPRHQMVVNTDSLPERVVQLGLDHLLPGEMSRARGRKAMRARKPSRIVETSYEFQRSIACYGARCVH